MLKYLFMLLVLMAFVGDWSLVQTGIFVVSFLFAVFYNHDFFMCNLRFGLGADYLSCILVLLSVWIMALIVVSSVKVKFVLNFPSLFLLVSLFLLFFFSINFQVYKLFIVLYCLRSFFNSYFDFNFGLSMPAWAYPGWGLYVVLHFVCIFASPGFFIMYF